MTGVRGSLTVQRIKFGIPGRFWDFDGTRLFIGTRWTTDVSGERWMILVVDGSTSLDPTWRLRPRLDPVWGRTRKVRFERDKGEVRGRFWVRHTLIQNTISGSSVPSLLYRSFWEWSFWHGSSSVPFQRGVPPYVPAYGMVCDHLSGSQKDSPQVEVRRSL